MGIELDKDLNNNAPRGQEVLISSKDSKVKIFVIPTDEEMVIAEETMKTIKK
jgi:acetate kinase